jgi:hypothetical protein
MGYVVGQDQGGIWGAIAGVVICLPVGAVLGPYVALLVAGIVLLALVPLILVGLVLYVGGLVVQDLFTRKEQAG